ncbi:hypothetical protein ACIBTV_00225 [Micromonospora sp. NPDC049366]
MTPVSRRAEVRGHEVHLHRAWLALAVARVDRARPVLLRPL